MTDYCLKSSLILRPKKITMHLEDNVQEALAAIDTRLASIKSFFAKKL